MSPAAQRVFASLNPHQVEKMTIAAQNILNSLATNQGSTLLQPAAETGPSTAVAISALHGKDTKKLPEVNAVIFKAIRPLNSWMAYRSKCLIDQLVAIR